MQPASSPPDGRRTARRTAAPFATRTLTRCSACGGHTLRALPLRYEYKGQAFPLVECVACGLRFLSVQPTGASLARLYATSYFEQDFRCGRSESGAFVEDAFREENRHLLEAFESLVPVGRLLEVGCAGGWLLKQAVERGWQAKGVEFSAEAVGHALSMGLDVVRGELADAGFAAGSFDLVYLGDVLEHVPDCRAVLAEVARVLRRGGHLYLRGPITTHSLARSLALLLYRWRPGGIVLKEPPYHLWEFTPRSLQALLRTVGFEVVRLEQSKIPPGRPHGDKTPLERVLMGAIDALNVPLTRAFQVWGDRVVVVARKA